jgi:hypothetical protein
MILFASKPKSRNRILVIFAMLVFMGFVFMFEAHL